MKKTPFLDAFIIQRDTSRAQQNESFGFGQEMFFDERFTATGRANGFCGDFVDRGKRGRV